MVKEAPVDPNKTTSPQYNTRLHQIPEKKPWKEILYDPVNNTILGRTSSSWCKYLDFLWTPQVAAHQATRTRHFFSHSCTKWRNAKSSKS